MLTLNDGRAELWHWDTGRTLSVDAECSQVHFSNKVFGRSIDVDVADGVATIPDILLQTDKELNVWAFAGTAENGYTKISKTFKVNRRNKPADYVFTQTDQMTLQTIQRQIGDLADLTTEAKDTLVAAINEAARTGGGAGSMDLRVAGGYVQYSRDGGMTWTNLIAMEDLKGDSGAPGADGKSAYQYAKDGGYTGTEAEFASKMAREYNPDAKTDAMTQAVGLDAAGKLWTEPGSGGGSSSEVWDTIIDTELTQDTGAVRFTSDTSGNPFSLKEFKIFVVQPPIDGQTVNNRVEFAPNGNGWGKIGNVTLKSSPKETENTVYSFIHVNTVDRHMNLLTALVSSNYSSVHNILVENTYRNNYGSTFAKKVNTTKNELNYLEMPVTSIGFVGITSVIFGAGTKILVRGIRS